MCPLLSLSLSSFFLFAFHFRECECIYLENVCTESALPKGQEEAAESELLCGREVSSGPSAGSHEWLFEREKCTAAGKSCSLSTQRGEMKVCVRGRERGGGCWKARAHTMAP